MEARPSEPAVALVPEEDLPPGVDARDYTL